MNEITKYQNKLNDIKFTGFRAVDSNLFFTICAKARDHQCTPIRMTFDEIKTLSGYDLTHGSNTDLIKAIDQTYRKMLDLNLRIDKPDGSGDYVVFSLFHRFGIFESTQEVEVRCTEELKDLLNEWVGGEWTAFRLDEYVSLKSTYSKHMYRLLKQWRMVGEHTWDIDEWRELLEVPPTYAMYNINQKVLKPIMGELPSYFHDLKIEKIKKGKGNKVVALKFTFVPKRPKSDGQVVDQKSKAEKLADLQAKEKAGELSNEQKHLKKKLEGEVAWMERNNIPDERKPSLLERFFGK